MATLYSGTIPQLLQGVSQQPKNQRLDGQNASQVNFDSDVSAGLTLRAGTKHIYKVSSVYEVDNAAIHSYERDDGKIISIVILPNGTVRAWVDFSAVYSIGSATSEITAYLTSDSPKDDFAFHTIVDRTFIVNKTITPAMTSSTSDQYGLSDRSKTIFPTAKWEVVIRGVAANFGITYTVYKDETSIATYTTASGTSADKITFIPINTVITNLATTLVALSDSTINYEQRGDYIHICGTGTTPPKFRVDDGRNGKDILVYTNVIDEVAKLPPKAPNGMVVKVTGTDKSEYNDYYMIAEEEGGESTTWQSSETVWKETLAPGITYEFDKDTLPVYIQDVSFDVFTAFSFGQPEWRNRRAGDNTSNPIPSFIGDRIVDISSYQSRLILLSTSAFIASQTNDFFDFFANSVRDVLADDPIDIEMPVSNTSPLNSIMPFSSNLLVMSEKHQFLVDGTRPLDPSSINLATEYDIKLDAAPALLGASMYTAIKHGPAYSGIREYFIESITANTNSNILSENAQKYIISDVKQIITNTNRNMVFILSTGEDTTITVFQQMWKDGIRVQSAWSKWIIDTDETTKILKLDIVDDTLYIWRKIGSSTLQTEAMNLRRYEVDSESELDFPVLLDCKFVIDINDCSINGDGDYEYTVSSLDINDYTKWSLVEIADSNQIGNSVEIRETSGGTTLVFEDAGFNANTMFIFGIKYSGTCELTLPQIKNRNGVSIDSNRLWLAHLDFIHTSVSNFIVNVTYKADPDNPYEHVWTPDEVDGWDSTLGSFSEVSDVFRTAICEITDFVTVEIDTREAYFPVTISAVNWQGRYKLEGRGL